MANLVTITCAVCGSEKTVKYSLRSQRFCSHSCSSRATAQRMTQMLEMLSVHGSSDECLEWPYANTNGYGIIGTKFKTRKQQRVTRLVYEMAHGPIPDGIKICHRCDNPPCFNPKHLFAGTHQDNMDDKRAKGRLLFGSRHQNSRLTEEMVGTMRALRAQGRTCQSIADEFSLPSYRHVWKVVTGKLWPHVPMQSPTPQS